jgi:hypothetical protein
MAREKLKPFSGGILGTSIHSVFIESLAPYHVYNKLSSDLFSKSDKSNLHPNWTLTSILISSFLEQNNLTSDVIP